MPSFSSLLSLVDQIHNSGRHIVISVTGGGSSFLGDLITVPGASRSILDARVPYSSPALAEWIGTEPESYCSRVPVLPKRMDVVHAQWPPSFAHHCHAMRGAGAGTRHSQRAPG